MLGAIIGDIVGSVYEFENIKTTDFPLFDDESSFTDDSVMAIAVTVALMNLTALTRERCRRPSSRFLKATDSRTRFVKRSR